MRILAIDPGPSQSAYVLWDGSHVEDKGILPNGELATALSGNYICFEESDITLFLEMIGHYGTGMPAGKEVFDTCVWIGRFIECWPWKHELILRPTIKTHLCGSSRAKDANVRQSLIDRFGSPGTKSAQGPLYGIKSHMWSALAVAVCAHDRLRIGDLK